jgi:hypothetical protein
MAPEFRPELHSGQTVLNRCAQRTSRRTLLPASAASRQLGHRLVGILHGCLKTNTGYDEHIMIGRRRRGWSDLDVIGNGLGRRA